jgi:glycosyltransferase involved in cell wall biosynthesis
VKVSVITVCYNSEKYIRDAIYSVNTQTYENIEHIFIDGNSSDSTVDIINQCSTRNTLLISEVDEGIYDAMNKGFDLASGDIICFLNSDDLYFGSDVIETVVNHFMSSKCHVLWGNLHYIFPDDTSKLFRIWKSKLIGETNLLRGEIPPHPTFFILAETRIEIGLFNLDYVLAADFDYMKRALLLNEIRKVFVDITLVKMRLGGATSKSFANILIQNFEIVRSLKASFRRFSTFKFLIYKVLNRVQQIIVVGFNRAR